MTLALRGLSLRNAFSALAFVALAAFYLVSAPQNHSTAPDSYSFARMITQDSISSVPQLRLFLWIAAMQSIQWVTALFVPAPDPFVLFAVLNAVQAALAVVLFERLLSGPLGLDQRAAWITAALFATCYGTWRYATELEIYSFCALISVVLVFLAVTVRPDRPAPPVLIAILAALATLSYQPMAILGALVIPICLLGRLPIRRVLWYYAVSGVVVAAGFALAHLLDSLHAGTTAQSIFDTDGSPVVLPRLPDVPKLAVGFLQNFLSVNWAFTFPPTERFVDHLFSTQFVQEIYAAKLSGSGYLVFVVTLPVAGVLFLIGCVSVWRGAPRTPLKAVELACLAWLVAYLVMIALIVPGGFEAWIPGLLPVFVLIGLRLVGPLAELGRNWLALALLAIFLIHNWFAGIAVFASREHSYYIVRGGPIVLQSGPGDLVVIGSDFELGEYLRFSGRAATLLVRLSGTEAAEERIRATLARGGSVILLDDVVSPGLGNPRASGQKAELEPVGAQYVDRGTRIDLGDGRYAIRIAPGL